MKHHRGLWLALSVASFSFVGLLGVGGCSNGATSVGSFTFTAISPAFRIPEEEATVNEWVSSQNDAAIRQHGWDIWAALTTSTGQFFAGRTLPVWETWFSPDEVYTADSVCSDFERNSGIAPFEEPHVHFKKGANDDSISAFNKYNDLYLNGVCDHQYNSAQVLTDLNQSFDSGGTPLLKRRIADFAMGTFALKPVFMLVKQTGLTSLPYWDGSGADKTTNTINPSASTWRQCVAVDPSHHTPAGTKVTQPCNGMTTTQVVYPLSSFYAIQLSQEEISNLSGDATGELTGAQVGDFAVLVAMHVTVRENPQWSWQTFWWEPDPDQAPVPAEPRMAENIKALSSPWDHYAMCTAYYMTIPPSDPNGPPKVCFNPYLEPGLPGLDGIHSNCMSCHSLASWGNGGQFGGGLDYQANGFVSDDDTRFGAVTRLDLLWSVTRAAAPASALSVSKFQQVMDPADQK